MQIVVPEDEDEIVIVHSESGEKLASWDIYHMVGKFTAKFERLLLVKAEARMGEKGEEFHYNEALLLKEPSSKTFRSGFNEGKVFIDIRMHINPKNSVRNHGTGFRVHEHNLPSLFGKSINLLEDNGK